VIKDGKYRYPVRTTPASMNLSCEATARTYEHPVQPSDPAHFLWRTDIRFDYRIRPPLLRSELLEDAQLGPFRPFRGFEGSNVPVPPDVASALAARAAPRLEPLPRENR
jgi:hypothetical protein